jgi:hypothetical protein
VLNISFTKRGRKRNKGIAIITTNNKQKSAVDKFSLLICFLIGLYNGWRIYEIKIPKKIARIIGLNTKTARIKTLIIKRRTIALFIVCLSTMPTECKSNL